ncbi:hypothetical protein PC9H_007181 [Pleurotus ostreatus]|uniref:Uncharacterized protein n=1 Tax=Pleurotus ostreatus TaxID=5322 RepID=A0A8H6ZTM2_PLEOS|nr:uncharacterized protein PC9H_007181 [Pleurotus ostreatus]KAF7427964.1 hypothetical protein PC9H_007181 [Pleurotus ostreatus]
MAKGPGFQRQVPMIAPGAFAINSGTHSNDSTSLVLLRLLVALKGVHNQFWGAIKQMRCLLLTVLPKLKTFKFNLGSIQLVLSRRPTLAASSLLPPITCLLLGVPSP